MVAPRDVLDYVINCFEELGKRAAHGLVADTISSFPESEAGWQSRVLFKNSRQPRSKLMLRSIGIFASASFLLSQMRHCFEHNLRILAKLLDIEAAIIIGAVKLAIQCLREIILRNRRCGEEPD
jgi:hypothetical protein